MPSEGMPSASCFESAARRRLGAAVIFRLVVSTVLVRLFVSFVVLARRVCVPQDVLDGRMTSFRLN